MDSARAGNEHKIVLIVNLVYRCNASIHLSKHHCLCHEVMGTFVRSYLNFIESSTGLCKNIVDAIQQVRQAWLL